MAWPNSRVRMHAWVRRLRNRGDGMRLGAVAAIATLVGVSTACLGCASATPRSEPTRPVTVVPTAVEPTDVAIDRMEQVLTGTVQRIGSCTVLVLGERRLPMVGVDSVAEGSRVTVRGSPVAVPSLCSRVGAGQALRVTTVRPA